MTDLDKLSRLLERATPGPWRDDNGYRVYADTPEGEVLLLSTKQTCATFADSGLIAALRNCAEELIRDSRAYRERAYIHAESSRICAEIGAVIRAGVEDEQLGRAVRKIVESRREAPTATPHTA